MTYRSFSRLLSFNLFIVRLLLNIKNIRNCEHARGVLWFSTIIYFDNVQRVPAPRKRSHSELQTSLSGRRVDIYVPTKAYGTQEARRKFPGKHSQIVERVYSPFRKRDFAGNPVIGTYVLSRARTRAALSRTSSFSASWAFPIFYWRSLNKCTINFKPLVPSGAAYH